MLTAERLRSLLSYDADTGIFIYLRHNSRPTHVNNRLMTLPTAGCLHRTGRWVIKIDDKIYFRGRLVWLYVYGDFPTGQIDHINCNTVDDRLSNLRAATMGQNQQNSGRNIINKSGHKGVSWNVARKAWVAKIQADHRRIFLGYFNNIDDAAAAYAAAARLYHGEFARIE